MIEGGLDNLDKVDAGDVDAEEPLEVDKMLGGEGVDRNEGVVDVMVDGDGDDIVVDAVVVLLVVQVVGGGVMMVGKLVVEVVAIGMSLTLATLGV
jgi:hypothetical protein